MRVGGIKRDTIIFINASSRTFTPLYDGGVEGVGRGINRENMGGGH
jgi:hypothetical protein